MTMNEISTESALGYLRAKFSEEYDAVFFTDSVGRKFDEVVDYPSVCQAKIIDGICANCEGQCKLPERIRTRNSRPVVKVNENFRGERYLDVRWTDGLECRFDPLSGKFGEMFKKSELTAEQQNMTFESYVCGKDTPDARRAKMEAMMSSAEKTCLILGGKRGTGKTHLAVAIALVAMKEGRQAIFKSVFRLLDEIWRAIDTHNDYFGLMEHFQTVPCLILDDLGKQNATNARMSYLHEIVNYRYNHNLQTVVTTNARTPEELSLWGGEFIFVFGEKAYKLNRTIPKRIAINPHITSLRRQSDGSMRRTSVRAHNDEPNKQLETVVAVPSERSSIRSKHPAVMPVKLPIEYIKAMTNEGDFVFEPFAGSGTTLIACEQTGRRCLAMEISEEYCEVIIERYMQEKKQNAVQ